MKEENAIVFGPVPSRRLGKSIGINNIPPKHCTYSCIYCQLGRTDHMQRKRESFYNPDYIITQTKDKIKHAKEKNEHIDYLTLVSDGEPTLDENLGELIIKLKRFGYPVAIITNGSLLSNEEIRNELLFVDWVSVKIDAITESIWREIDRPPGGFNISEILQGIEHFSEEFTSKLYTETMLIQNMNDTLDELKNLSCFIAKLKPETCYLSIPIRPPAEHWVKPASEQTLALAYQIFTDKGIQVEYLIGYEGNEFAFTGNAEQDILSITAVHPMRQDAMEKFLKKADENWDLINRLIKENKLVKHTLKNIAFYSRKFEER